MTHRFECFRRYRVAGICAVLILLVLMVFGSSTSFEFVNYDDGHYVYGNEQITNGVTLDGIKWFLTNPHHSNWHPLASFSHMIDCQLYGLTPFGHHLGNLILHALSAVFLFAALYRMTGSVWRSALVAALFAIHPLRAESVVWISERKDVLCGLFFMLTLWSYTAYAKQAFSFTRYVLVILFFTLGLLSKPMIITLPFVLLLFDFWPLRRTDLHRVFLEKLPLLFLAAVFGVITIWAQKGAIAPTETLPFPWRVGNAFFSYITYIQQLFWPQNLAALYPSQSVDLSAVNVFASALLIAGMTVVCFWQRKAKPYLLAGWLWYLGMLVPVIGILQVGSQAHADRYTYLPHIGLLIMIIWFCAEQVDTRRRQIIAAVLSVFILASLVTLARKQTGYWRDSITLWTHTLECTHSNHVAHANLGAALLVNDQPAQAAHHLEESVALEPRQAEAHNNLAVAYAELGDYTQAAKSLKTAILLAEKSLDEEVVAAMVLRLKQYRAEQIEKEEK